MSLDRGVQTGVGDEWIRIGATKIVADGSLIAQRAAMCCEYADAPDRSGFLHRDEEWVKPAGVVCDGYRVIFRSVRR